MDIAATRTAMRRAHKALAHATRQIEHAPSPKAKARHERRLRSAQRRLGEAVYTFEMLALQEA